MEEQKPGKCINPPSMYEICLGTYVESLNLKVGCLNTIDMLRYLPVEVLGDIFMAMSQKNILNDVLFEQLSDLQTFARLLRYDPARQKLFTCLATLMNNNKPLAAELQQKYTKRYGVITKRQKRNNLHMPVDDGISTSLRNNKCTNGEMGDAALNEEILLEQIIAQADDLALLHADDALVLDMPVNAIDFGMRLGSFMSEAGWLTESIQVLQCVAFKLRTLQPTEIEADYAIQLQRLDCLQRLLQAESALCNFRTAERTFTETTNLLNKLQTNSVPNTLLANIYAQFSAMYFTRNEYNESYFWSLEAIKLLTKHTPERVIVDVLRQGAKSCVVKRDFQRANLLICQALGRARKHFGEQHQKCGDVLLDYGFFLLNVDCVAHSVQVYKTALEIKSNIFGKRNFHVAIAHEDLSYAYYVHEYSTGNFASSRDHVEKAVDILKDIVPSDHLKLASAKRVKALLLEEIALDKMSEGGKEDELLKQSEELHKFALQLSLEVFGEINVQTAKHYGNLGRLYQTMNRFEEAESMHLKAIKIKTDLLGACDYEVGLSVGHLASLYNYQMKKYKDAEKLYLRSIEISLRLFGRSYSGLEYDYLGLCHVYECLREFEKYVQYANMLENWQSLRSQNMNMNRVKYPTDFKECTLDELKHNFFKLSQVESEVSATN